MMGAAPKAMIDVLRLEHQFAGRRRILRAQLHHARPLAPFAALYSQLLESPNPAFIARAPRFHALADPRLLLRQLFVEQGGVLGFDLERRSLLHHVVVVAARPNA